jgi:hypothetical protein
VLSVGEQVDTQWALNKKREAQRTEGRGNAPTRSDAVDGAADRRGHGKPRMRPHASARARRRERFDTAMPYISDFDTDAIISALTAIGQKHPEGSPERDVIELAQIAVV